MFTLAKLTYYTCSDEEKEDYDDLETLTIDYQPYCIHILRYQKKKSKFNIVDNDMDVKFMDDEGKQ